MPKLDPKKIISLLEDGKQKEAGEMLQQYLREANLSKLEIGQTLAETAELYIRANNSLLESYNTFLKEVLKELQALKKKGQL